MPDLAPLAVQLDLEARPRTRLGARPECEASIAHLEHLALDRREEIQELIDQGDHGRGGGGAGGRLLRLGLGRGADGDDK
jgi:hypothetical protein